MDPVGSRYRTIGSPKSCVDAVNKITSKRSLTISRNCFRFGLNRTDTSTFSPPNCLK